MPQALQYLIAELRSAWRFRWIGVPIAWAVFVVGFAWVALQPNVYEATARVYIDTSSALRPVLGNQIVAPDIMTQLQYVRQALLGREQLQRVARETNLDAGVVTPEDWEDVIQALRTQVSIEGGVAARNAPQNNNTYSIRYRNPDRETAAAVVTSVLNALVEDTLGQNITGSATAERFLDERITEYEKRLADLDREIAEFKRVNADRLPGTEGGYFTRIQNERAQLEEAQKALRLALSRREQLVAQLTSETPVVPGSEIEPPPNSIDARIRDHRLQLDRLLLEYTERHPDVIAVREALERLEAQRYEQLRALGITDADQQLSSLGSNPVYQAVQIAINETDVEITTLRADIDDRTRKLEALQASVDEVPQIEAELARLTRGYEVLYDQYQGVVQSRETQSLTSKAADADQVEFRIIDQPLARFEPVAPNRLGLLGMVFVVALGAGGGACWLLAQLRPVFSSTTSLRELTGLPVLGAVSQAWEARYRLQRRVALTSFAGAIGGLVLLFVAAAVVEIAGPGLHALAGLV